MSLPDQALIVTQPTTVSIQRMRPKMWPAFIPAQTKVRRNEIVTRIGIWAIVDEVKRLPVRGQRAHMACVRTFTTAHFSMSSVPLIGRKRARQRNDVLTKRFPLIFAWAIWRNVWGNCLCVLHEFGFECAKMMIWLKIYFSILYSAVNGCDLYANTYKLPPYNVDPLETNNLV